MLTVRNGLLELIDQTALPANAVTYSLFLEAARTGIPLSLKAEGCIGYVLNHRELVSRNAEVIRTTLREILSSDYPGLALRPMQRLGVLSEVLPEFAAIDSLVVRDFYHRYTVDEHTLRTIEHLQELAYPVDDDRAAHFASLWKTVERRDLLVLSLLLHDVGKGMAAGNHVAGSLAALDTVAHRLQRSSEENATVRFLVGHHLAMSHATQRRA